MKKNKQQGFSLLEILIAFSILALSLGILLRIFSGGVNTASVTEEYVVAMQIAESLKSNTGNESALVAGQTTGIENEKYRWEVNVSPYNFNPDNSDISALPVELFKVKVRVGWGDANEDDRVIELTTIKLVTKPV